MVVPGPEKPPLVEAKQPAQPESAAKLPSQAPKRMDLSEKKAKKEGLDAEKIAELTELLQRTRAEFENYQKRSEKEKTAARILGQAQTLAALLSVWDSFDHALQKGNREQQQTLEPLARQFKETLLKLGVSPIPSKGRIFDPNLHECLLVENNATEKDHVITQEIQTGFLFGDLVLRHAKVKVNRRVQEKSEEQS